MGRSVVSYTDIRRGQKREHVSDEGSYECNLSFCLDEIGRCNGYDFIVADPRGGIEQARIGDDAAEKVVERLELAHGLREGVAAFDAGVIGVQGRVTVRRISWITPLTRLASRYSVMYFMERP